MIKFIKNIYSYYIESWDFILSAVLSMIGTIFILTVKGNHQVYSNITKNFSIFIPILAIFVTLSTLSLLVMFASVDDEFIDYLEDKGNGAYSKLIEYHKTGFIIYFSSLLLNISLQIDYNFSIIFTIVAIFLTIYSLFYSMSLIEHILKLMGYKTEYIKRS